MHYCGAKVQLNYNCYKVYFYECLRNSYKFIERSCINLMLHERFIKVKHPDNIVIVECICNNSWHCIRRLFVFYDFPITIFSTIFSDDNTHRLKLGDMSLEGSELYASLLRHFTSRNRRVE